MCDISHNTADSKSFKQKACSCFWHGKNNHCQENQEERNNCRNDEINDAHIFILDCLILYFDLFCINTIETERNS